jgi:hypothetical protein
VRVCCSSLPPLSSFECLEVYQDPYEAPKYKAGDIETAQWLELFRPFSSVKDLIVPCKEMIRIVAPALAELAGQRGAEVLPLLQNLFLDLRDLGPVQETIDQFIATRKRFGGPVDVHRAPHIPFG